MAALTVTTAHAEAAGPKSIAASGTYPIYISKSGSYVLTGNLVLPKAGTRGIVIQKPDVTIDFNGFTLASPTGGHEPGIYANSAAIDAVVKNGTVTGFGGDGAPSWRLLNCAEHARRTKRWRRNSCRLRLFDKLLPFS